MRTLPTGEATRNRILAWVLLKNGAVSSWRRLGNCAASQVVLLAHLALAVSSYLLAIGLISHERAGAWASEVVPGTVGVVVLLRFAGVLWMQLHRRSLRCANSLDLVAIGKAVLAGSALFWTTTLILFRHLSIPAAVFLMDSAFLILLWSGLHFGSRVLQAWNAAARKSGKPVVIVGAGDAAASVLKEFELDPDSPCRAVAIVDDDPRKWNDSICGVPVKGGIKDVGRIAVEKRAAEILICIPSATRGQMRQILTACRESNVPVQTLPSLSELVGGKVSWRDFRRPQIGDLLQRDEVLLDPRETREVVGGKSVLVTGAGGSIGSELCRQLAAADPRKLLLLDHSENGLFYAHLEACKRLGAERAAPLLLDLLRSDDLREMMRREKPDIVFHAAAHKHVGLLETHAHEAIRNNVLSTRNLAQAAVECGTKRLVNISTDKAVSPRNYMGVSKKLTELCIQEFARQSGARFSSVRFGNVAGSTGSVLSLFWDQIQNGGPVYVTDPRATRYFMTIPEAVQLIVRAASLSKGGETFVFDMGEPVNIYQLARAMTLFSGHKPGEDIRIEFTGLKRGEKVREQLWEPWEHALSTECPRVLAIRENNPASRDILAKIRKMERFLALEEYEALLGFVQEVVPEFHPASPPFQAAPAGYHRSQAVEPLEVA